MKPTAVPDREQMRVLVAIADHGSFTRAAEEFGITQQAVSAAIKRLETRLGRPVVARSKRGTRLTQDGEALLRYARQMIGLSERIERHFAQAPAEGTLRIGFVDGFDTTALPIALAELRRLHPNLEIGAETNRTDILLSRLSAGSLDFMVGIQRAGAGLGEVVGLVALTWAGRTDADDPTASVPLIVPPAPDLLRALTVEAIEAAGRPWAVRFESASRESRRAAARAGLGLALFAAALENRESPAEGWSPPPPAPFEVIMRVASGANVFAERFSSLVREAVSLFLSP